MTDKTAAARQKRFRERKKSNGQANGAPEPDLEVCHNSNSVVTEPPAEIVANDDAPPQSLIDALNALVAGGQVKGAEKLPANYFSIEAAEVAEACIMRREVDGMQVVFVNLGRPQQPQWVAIARMEWKPAPGGGGMRYLHARRFLATVTVPMLRGLEGAFGRADNTTYLGGHQPPPGHDFFPIVIQAAALVGTASGTKALWIRWGSWVGCGSRRPRHRSEPYKDDPLKRGQRLHEGVKPDVPAQHPKINVT